MATSIMILGEVGTGKSTSLKNLPPEETVLIRPNHKPLPWRGWRRQWSEEKKNLFFNNRLMGVHEMLNNISAKAQHVKYIVIEDFTHFLTRKELADKDIHNYDKWTDFANQIDKVVYDLDARFPDGVFVILIGHTRLDNGKAVLQTSGKMTDDKIKPSSMFSYVLHTIVTGNAEDRDVKFLTQADSTHEAKSPMGALEIHEPNDVKAICDKIYEYEMGDDEGRA